MPDRDAAARAKLRPLAPGERPLGLRLAVALAALIALGNVVVLAVGGQSSGSRSGGIAFAVVMALAAVGMWQRRYWAVLGFELLLGISIAYAALSLALASNLAGALAALAVIAICAPLFWLLIRVMGRMQTPRRPTRDPAP